MEEIDKARETREKGEDKEVLIFSCLFLNMVT